MDLRLAICQVESTNSVSRNTQKIIEIVSSTPADIFLFPEMFLTRYGNTDFDSEEVESASEELIELCRSRDTTLVVGKPTLGDTKHISLTFFTPEGTQKYDKMYLANFPPYNEGIFEPGSSPLIVSWKDWKIGLEICYDVMFPEIHRHYATHGADVVLVASASALKSEKAMMTILPARSLENTVYTAYCNNIGIGPAGPYFGGSVLISPLGDILKQAGEDEEILTVVLTKDVLENARNIRHHLEDLRNDIKW